MLLQNIAQIHDKFFHAIIEPKLEINSRFKVRIVPLTRGKVNSDFGLEIGPFLLLILPKWYLKINTNFWLIFLLEIYGKGHEF